MDDLSQLLLELYRAAQAMPVAEFPDFALVLVKSLLPFDSARLVGRSTWDSQRLEVQSVHLHNEPENMVLDWVTISRLDVVLKHVVTHPGRAWRFHAPTLFAGRDMAVMRDYIERYQHLNTMSYAHLSRNNGRWQRGKPMQGQGLSLFRADPDDMFTAEQSMLLNQLAPHVIEATAINQALAVCEHAPENRRGGTGIVGAQGLLAYCDAILEGLLQEVWPDWRGPRLPTPLWQALVLGDSNGHIGGSVRFTTSRVGELLFLRGERLSPLARLSPREAAIARLYGEGKSYKEIAKTLGLSPATVRNYLARAYAKLEVSDKAELAVLLAREDGG